MGYNLPEGMSIHCRGTHSASNPSFKHTGLFPRTGSKLGLVLRHYPQFGSVLYQKVSIFSPCSCSGASPALPKRSKRHSCGRIQGMVSWAKTLAASGLSDAPIRWLVNDCVKFVEIHHGNTYDGIIMDPPSYGRLKVKSGKSKESIFPFVKLCSQLLSKDARFFLINSYTTGLQPAILPI